MDFRLDADTWDVPIEAGRLAEVTDEIEEAKQIVQVATKTHLGECAYDENRGLPWSEEILVHAPDLNLVRARIHALYVSLEVVDTVLSVQVELDAAAREMTFTAHIKFKAGLADPFDTRVQL